MAKRFISVMGDNDCSDEGFVWGVVVFVFSSACCFSIFALRPIIYQITKGGISPWYK